MHDYEANDFRALERVLRRLRRRTIRAVLGLLAVGLVAGLALAWLLTR